MNYLLLVAYLSMIFSCTSNPFWQDGERGFPAISGIATAEQNEFNAPIFVWIKELMNTIVSLYNKRREG